MSQVTPIGGALGHFPHQIDSAQVEKLMSQSHMSHGRESGIAQRKQPEVRADIWGQLTLLGIYKGDITGEHFRVPRVTQVLAHVEVLATGSTQAIESEPTGIAKPRRGIEKAIKAKTEKAFEQAPADQRRVTLEQRIMSDRKATFKLNVRESVRKIAKFVKYNLSWSQLNAGELSLISEERTQAKKVNRAMPKGKAAKGYQGMTAKQRGTHMAQNELPEQRQGRGTSSVG